MIQKEAKRLSDILKFFEAKFDFDLYITINVGSETIRHKCGSYTLANHVLSNMINQDIPNEIEASKINLTGFLVKSIELCNNKLNIYTEPCTPKNENVNVRNLKGEKVNG